MLQLTKENHVQEKSLPIEITVTSRMHHPWKAPIWIQGILIYLFQSPKNGCLTLTLNLKMNLAVGVPVKLLRSCKQGQIRTTHKRVDSLELDKYMH